MPDPVRVGPWVTGYRGYWYRMFPDQLIACCVAQYGWNVTGPMSIFTGEIIASGPEDGDEGKRHADSIAESLGWILERDPATEPTPGPNRVRDAAVIAEIMAERERAFAKWGPQPYPWTCYEDEDINGLHDIAERLERVARDAMAERAAKGLPPTRAQIVAEEAGEALRETDPKRARKELIQLGAMVVAALSECPHLREEE